MNLKFISLQSSQLCLLTFIIIPFGVMGQTESFSPINDSTVTRYRYEVEEKTYAKVPRGTAIDQIDLSEIDRLKPRHEKFKITEGINGQSQSYYQIETIKADHNEDWLSTPKIRLLTPTGSFGYDEQGEQDYFFPNNDIEKDAMSEETQTVWSEGYYPVMMFFLNKHHEYVQALINDGYSFQELSHNAFKLSKLEEKIIYDPEHKRITHHYSIDNMRYEIETQYTLYAPYGYVPTWEIENRTRLDLPNPVTFVCYKNYSNHVIEDLNSEIAKFTEESHVEVFPNPVDDVYELALVGIPDAQVSQIQIRDHMGNIIFNHINPQVQGDIIELNAQNYSSGPLILILSTQQGLYTTNIIKNN